jgi:hypothetical protein
VESLKYFQSTLDTLRLEKYDDLVFRGASCVKFKNAFFRLQLLNDRGISEAGISSLFGEEQFRGIEMYKSLLTLEKSPNLSKREARKIIGTRLDFESQCKFLLENIGWLHVVLNEINYQGTLQKIDTVGIKI